MVYNNIYERLSKAKTRKEFPNGPKIYQHTNFDIRDLRYKR